MISRFPALATVAAAGLAFSVTACASSPASTAHTAASPAVRASSPAASPSPAAAAVPAGYQRMGGPGSGISLDIPASWVVLHPTTGTLANAMRKSGIRLHDGLTSAQLIQDIQSVVERHGVIAFDITSQAVSGGFATNINAFCGASGVTDTGSAAIPALKQVARTAFQMMGGTVTSQQDVMIGGIPGVRTVYTLKTAAGLLPAAQLEVLPRPNVGCYITTTGTAPASVIQQAAASARFY
jgi:hypothetical protein